ncbi:hypothetical protein QUQ58_004458 [Escherichia coli]|nr:hypothetical protein [Escherichia coli]
MFALLLNGKPLDPATFIDVGYVTLRPVYVSHLPQVIKHAVVSVGHENVLPVLAGRAWLTYLIQN